MRTDEIHVVHDRLSDGQKVHGVLLHGDIGWAWIVTEDKASADELYNLLDSTMIMTFVSATMGSENENTGISDQTDVVADQDFEHERGNHCEADLWGNGFGLAAGISVAQIYA